jgi:hypothetical protein
MIIGRYKVSSTSGYGKAPLSYVRVYEAYELIAEVALCRGSPLKYLQGLTRSKHRDSLRHQLEAKKVPDDVIDKILNG